MKNFNVILCDRYNKKNLKVYKRDYSVIIIIFVITIKTSNQDVNNIFHFMQFTL